MTYTENAENSKLRSRLEKLAALAERGVGGEKVTARKMLNNLLKKHALTLDDLSRDIISLHWIKFKRGKIFRQLLNQIIYKVCDERETWRSKVNQNCIGVECTEYQRLQIEMQLDIYQRALGVALDDCYSAFVQVNKIFPDNAPEACNKDLTEEERESIERMLTMASGMRPESIYPRLNNLTTPPTEDKNQ